MQHALKAPRTRRRLLRTAILPVGALAFVGAGCEFSSLLLQLLLVFMGASPAANFGNNGQVDLNMVPINESGEVQFLTNALYEVEVTNPPNTTAEVDTVESKPARELGTFAVLLDSSGSMRESDPDRKRVVATTALTREVLKRTPNSRMGIFDFGVGASSGFAVTRELTAYTSDPDALAAGADKTSDDGDTPLYDALLESLNAMNSEVLATFQTEPVDKAIVVLSDGEDTASSASLREVISRANQLEIPVHVIGLADASEFGNGNGATFRTTGAVSDLRRLARDTGGVYASVYSADDLVELANTIALSLTGGFETTNVKLNPVPPPGSLVEGRVKIRGISDALEGSELGERLTGQWQFVAPQ